MPTLKTTSGIEWNYCLEGKGHPQVLVFLHGWGVDGRIWRQQTKYFSQVCVALSIDLPGHGQTSWQKVSLAVMARDLKEILEALKISRFSMVGSSLGGLLALKFYELFPTMVERMILVGVLPKFAKSEDFPYGLAVHQMRKLGRQVGSSYPAIINIFFRSLFTIEERESRRFKWLQKFRQWDAAPMQEALMEYLDVLEAEDLRDVFKNITTPVQIINGDEDPICSVQTVSYMKGILPQARVDYFKHCGHFPFLSKPHEFNQVLENFLRDSVQ